MRNFVVVLHIAALSGDPFSGVDCSVPRHILAQQKLEQVGLLNLENCPIEGVQNMFLYGQTHGIRRLPMPFQRPDLVVFHEIYRPLYLKLYRELLRLGIPYIVFPHGGLTAEAQRRKAFKKAVANRLLFDRFLNNAAAIQCLSPNELKYSTTQAPKFVGTNGVEMPNNGMKDFSGEGLCFLSIGRIDLKIKGLDLLVEAIRMERDFLLENHCRFAVYGPDIQNSRKKLNRLIQKTQVETLVTLGHGITGREKAEALRGADYFIQASRTEGMSMGILEALSYGLPCIVTSGTGMAEFVRAHGAGFGCGADAGEIAAAIHEAVEKAGERAAMSKKARSSVRECYHWDDIAADTVQMYRALISKQKDAPCSS